MKGNGTSFLPNENALAPFEVTDNELFKGTQFLRINMTWTGLVLFWCVYILFRFSSFHKLFCQEGGELTDESEQHLQFVVLHKFCFPFSTKE